MCFLVSALSMALLGCVPTDMPTESPTPSPSASPGPVSAQFGDIGTLQEILQSGGFRVSASSGLLEATAGTAVHVRVADEGSDGEFDSVTLEISPLTALDDDPVAGPTVDFVLALFDSWSPEAGARTREVLQGPRGTVQTREETTEPVDGGFTLHLDLSYGHDSASEDYFRATLARPD